MIPYGQHYVDDVDIEAVTNILRNGQLTQGAEISRFEQAICEFTGAQYGVAVASATAGLHLAAMACDLGPGDAALTTPITFVATPNAAIYCGADVVLGDVCPQTINLDPDHIDEVLNANPAIKAIFPVHFAGLPCDMDRIGTIARKRRIRVIEDAAHALGARYADGSMVGCGRHADMTVFSFHPVKAIAAGEGGMIVTNDEALYRRLIRLRSHGINKLTDPYVDPGAAETDGEPNPWYYEMQELGYHYRITDIQCALARSQLAKLPDFIARRLALVEQYDAAFEGISHIRPIQQGHRSSSGHHIYVLRIDFAELNTTRAIFMNEMKARGIGSQVHYIPISHQPFYRTKGLKTSDYPEAAAYYEEALSIPLFYKLSNEVQRQVCETIIDLSRARR